MGIISAVVTIVLVAILGDTIAKIARARGQAPRRVGGLDDLQRQIEAQNEIISDQERRLVELNERTDFLERLLTNKQEPKALPRGDASGDRPTP